MLRRKVIQLKEYRECGLWGGDAVYIGWSEKAILIKWPLSRDLKVVREQAMQKFGKYFQTEEWKGQKP